MAVRPIASYPPEFFEVWAKALGGNLVLTFPTRGKATNFKHRLYAFRKRLSEAQMHPEFYSVDLEVEPLSDGNFALKSFIPEWKKQLVNMPKTIVEEAIKRSQVAGPEPEDHVTEALKKAGFFTG